MSSLRRMEPERATATVPLMRPYLTRDRPVPPRLVDAILTFALVALSTGESIAFGDGDSSTVIAATVAAAGLLTMALRRTRPVVPLLTIPLTSGLAAILADFYLQETAAPFLAFMLSLYSVARYGSAAERGWPAAISLLLTAVISGVAGGVDQVTQYMWFIVLGGTPYLIGRVFANRARLRRELRDRTVELERDQAARAEHAVENERSRIAGELQAAVANGISAMVIQAEAVPRALAAGREEAAATALNLIEETGRDSLGEMRRLLGVLRHDSDGISLAPQPTMEAVDRLATSVRDRGLDVQLEFEGERIPLGAGPDLAAYRVLQDALAAAVDAEASAARVIVGFHADELRLDVSDDRDRAAVDAGPLLAMRERLGLYGGRVKAEALSGGGFRVVARLPHGGVRA